MEYLPILLIFVLFALPALLLSRTNRKRVEKARALQAAAKPGDRIVTVSGFHGDIVSAGETTIGVELAPGVVVTMEREGVYKVLDNEEGTNQPGNAAAGSTVHETGTEVEDER
ncbi:MULTISPECIES: preprotein translocase subunit YajC [unclassified Corynebacterium]|uniref:preprotein translocase subunit YajC n=1 Tax=unclassified Corynebacterium TaxID=2624378 RepID=UPI00265416EE|nr:MULTISPECIES: preprotein translocase subunit YajC [unclassified Corynebacterium]MDN8593850.1 preprotein translocase subunit YajC [Corynebacterium sp. P4_F2]WKK55955.1 preprotein translocase subunit YajC [Corynebacterium sp. P4-C1]WKK63366.1 preprotein translocase subunit YajC [Corynebacterium sp. P8-C1]